MSKKRFVDFYLAAMLKAATDGQVIRLDYSVQGQQEIVTVYHTGGSRRVNVTGNNRLFIAVDVLREVTKL